MPFGTNVFKSHNFWDFLPFLDSEIDQNIWAPQDASYIERARFLRTIQLFGLCFSVHQLALVSAVMLVSLAT